MLPRSVGIACRSWIRDFPRNSFFPRQLSFSPALVITRPYFSVSDDQLEDEDGEVLREVQTEDEELQELLLFANALHAAVAEAQKRGILTETEVIVETNSHDVLHTLSDALLEADDDIVYRPSNRPDSSNGSGFWWVLKHYWAYFALGLLWIFLRKYRRTKRERKDEERMILGSNVTAVEPCVEPTRQRKEQEDEGS